MSCFDLTHAPVATTARAAATGLVSMSNRPDPEGSDTVEIATRRCPRLRVVWDLIELHPLTKTQAMEPSRQTWSSYGPPYPLGRWSSVRVSYDDRKKKPGYWPARFFLTWGVHSTLTLVQCIPAPECLVAFGKSRLSLCLFLWGRVLVEW